MNKKLLALLLAICTLALLVSCGGNTPKEDAAADPTAEPTAEVTPETTPEAAPSPVMVFSSLPTDYLYWEIVSRGMIQYDGNL